MKQQKNIPGFTIVELIVMTLILAILTTMGFISLRGYTQDSRNSSRIADLKTLDKAMKVYVVRQGTFPLPDEKTNISYSGATAWYQGVFGTGAIGQLGGISNITRDPLTDNLYSYSLTNNRQRYEIGAAFENSRLFSVVPQSYALSNSDHYAYNIGNFITYDLGVTDGNWCNVLALPSLILSEIPSGGSIINGGNYKFSYMDSPHIPASYSGVIDDTISASSFTLARVFDGCHMHTIEEMELYAALLSTAYQPLSSIEKFQPVVFNSNSEAFQKQSLKNLQSNGISIGRPLEKSLEATIVYRSFNDAFTDTDGTLLIGGYIPAPLESWNLVSGGDAAAYSIESNKLQKNGATNSLVYPTPEPAVSYADYGIQFDIEDFAGGMISIYLRYVDSNNYYKLELTSAGYHIIKREGGSDSTISNILDPIFPGNNVSFFITGDSLVFSIDDIEKENIVAPGISGVGVPAISLQNGGAQIDNYTLTYR